MENPRLMFWTRCANFFGAWTYYVYVTCNMLKLKYVELECKQQKSGSLFPFVQIIVVLVICQQNMNGVVVIKYTPLNPIKVMLRLL